MEDRAAGLIHEAKKHFPRAVAEGILQRVRDGGELPFRAPELMADADFAFEEDALLEMALVENDRDDRADAAASVLGPHSVGQMIDRMFELEEGLEIAMASTIKRALTAIVQSETGLDSRQSGISSLRSKCSPGMRATIGYLSWPA